MAEAKKKPAVKKTAKKAPIKAIKPEKEVKDGTVEKNSSDQVQTTQEAEVKTETKATKAGKRSPKALKEAEDKAEKEERKSDTKEDSAETKPKKAAKPARSRLERRSKKYREAAKLLETDKQYSLAQSLELATKTSTVKFDATVELHVNLAVDPKQADQNVRDTVVLPAGTGKSVKIAVFAEADDVAKAKKAGADIAAGDEFLQQLDKGVLDFDVLIATPSVMARLGKYAKVLGPKGLMPNPKSGTVSADVTKAVTEAKGGKVEYRVDSTGIIHLGIGKVSFGAAKLLENAQAILSSVKGNKPASIKGNYIQTVHISTTMGPGIRVLTSDL